MTADFIKQHLALTNSGKSLSWLSALNERGQAAFANAKVPTRKTENWKYTSLNLLAGDDNVAKFANAAPLTSANFDAASLPVINDLNAMRLVVVNGQVDVDASDQSALDLVVRFSDASTEQQAQITEQLGSIIGERGHLFNQLNDASINDGIFISVDRNQRLEVPLYICYVHTKEHEAFSTHTRLLVLLDVNAEATIVEEYRDQGNGLSFVNHVSEIRVGDNAKLTHYRLQMMQENILHVGSTHIDLQRDAQYQGFHLGLGTALTRNDVVINHNVGGSHCELNGVYVPKNKQVIDFHTSIDHKAAYCTSDEVFRGIMNDHSKAIFNGRIHIHPDAQKTLAQLSNKNLLMTNTAEINTKPELEIYADDVKCAHGATVAQLDNKGLFYLQSRGLSKTDAEVLLSFGFINELIDGLAHEPVSDYLRPLLAARFGRDDLLSSDMV